MGITGLLPLLKPVTKDVHIRELKGLTVGVDTYCWLHKGIYSCSAELCQGIPTDKFIKYCVERVHLLLSHGVKPYLVFDGGHLPAKAGKEEERRARRESNLQRGMQLTREGNPSGAHQFFCKAADVTPFMAHQVIQVIKRIPGVRYVVAPYEADAQLGFLARNGHVDAVITEDSDIMLFGCTRVVFKLDRDGTGQEVDLREVFSRRNDELDMRGMNEDDLMTLCALSGCDYLPSVHGMGLKKAYRMVSRHKELAKILRAVKFDSAGSFPRGYEADFQRALLTFRHQRAFDPVSRSVVHMTPLPEILPSAIMTAPSAVDDGRRDRVLDRAAALAFLGPPVEQERGCAVADGDVDPITGDTFSEMGGQACGKDGAETPEGAMSDAAAAALAVWRGGSVPAPGGGGGAGKTKKLSAQGNNLTKYWGAPLSSSKKSGAKRSGAAAAAGGLASGRGGFEFGGGGATPDRPPRATAFGGGRAAASGTLEKKLDPDRASPAQSPACVSPGSFYAGVSPSPPPPPPPPPASASSSGEVNGCEDKENQDPLSMPPPPLEDNSSGGQGEEDDSPAASTSKFFGGSGGGGDRGAVAVQPSGLRRRFRPPLAVGRNSAAGAVSGRSALRGDHGGDIGAGDTDPWGGADYAYPRLDVPRETAAVAGGSGCGGGGGRLKRRRTLGLGSVAPSGMIRGLEGVGGGGAGGPGRRSKSLGGAPSAARFDYEDDNGNGNGNGNEAGCVGDAGGGCVNNLFERFAARPQQHHPPRATPIGRPPPAAWEKPGATDGGDGATVATSELRAATSSPAAPTLSEADDDNDHDHDHHHNTELKRTVQPGTAAAGAEEDGAGRSDDDAPLPGELFAQNDTSTRAAPLAAAAAPLSSPPARENSQGRTADRRRAGADGDHDVGGSASVDGKGTTYAKSSCSVINKRREDNICRRSSSGSAGSSERRKKSSGGSSSTAAGRKTKDLAGGDDGGLTPDIFAQFMYSPPSSR